MVQKSTVPVTGTVRRHGTRDVKVQVITMRAFEYGLIAKLKFGPVEYFVHIACEYFTRIGKTRESVC